MVGRQPNWAGNPIVVLPLCFFAFGLAVVPLALASSDHAAEFYGAFTAAMIAAAAAAAGWIYQSRTEIAKEERARVASRAEKGVFIYAYLCSTRATLVRIKAILDALQYQKAAFSPNSPEDQTIAHASTIRTALQRLALLPFETLLNRCLVFETDLAVEIVHVVDQIIVGESVWRMEIYQANLTVSRATIDGVVSVVQQRITLLNDVIDKVPVQSHS